MAWFSVEVTGKHFFVKINESKKDLNFLTIRIVEAESEKQAQISALAEVMELSEYAQLVEQRLQDVPNLEVSDIELLSDSEIIDSVSTGLIFYDP